MEVNEEQYDDVTKEQFVKAINKVKNSKAAELIRCLGTQGKGLLLKIINLA